LDLFATLGATEGASAFRHGRERRLAASAEIMTSFKQSFQGFCLGFVFCADFNLKSFRRFANVAFNLFAQRRQILMTTTNHTSHLLSF
jgi:hypothetical protein